MKYYNGLNMGEGIAGTDEIGAQTTTLHTCMGIAMVNRNKRFGCLYHYPADTLRNPNVSGAIRQMANDIAPDEILLTPARGFYKHNSGSQPIDIENMQEFLGKLCNTVTLAKVENLARLYWNIDGPVFNAAPEGVDEEEAEVPQRFRSTMSTGARELEANVWYYGGDGEIGDVLEQGLETTKPKSRKTCIIL